MIYILRIILVTTILAQNTNTKERLCNINIGDTIDSVEKFWKLHMFVMTPYITSSGKKSPFWVISDGIEEFKVASKKSAIALLNYFENISDATSKSGRLLAEPKPNTRGTESIRCSTASDSTVQMEQGGESIYQRSNSEYPCTNSDAQGSGITDIVTNTENRSISVWDEANQSQELSTDNQGSNEKNSNINTNFVQQVCKLFDGFAQRSEEQHNRVVNCERISEQQHRIVLDCGEIVREQHERVQEMCGYVDEAHRIVSFVAEAVGCGNDNFQKYYCDENDVGNYDSNTARNGQSTGQRTNSKRSNGTVNRKPVNHYKDAINVEYSYT